MAQTEATHVAAPAAPQAPPAPPAPVGDPGIVGLPTFIVGSICLALTLQDIVKPESQGAAVPVIITATVLGQWFAAIWAARLANNAVAAVYGVFGGFWFSYAILLLGLGHGWYGVATADVTRTVETFLAAWLILIVLLTLGTLALPWSFTLLFVLVDLALASVLAGTIQGSSALRHLGGWAVWGFLIVGCYLWLGSLRQATGKEGLPLGRPIL